MKSLLLAGVLFLSLSVAEASAEFLLGVGIHMHEIDPEKAFSTLRSLDIDSIRDDLNWRGVERTKGNLVFPAKYRLYADRLPELAMTPLVILNYPNDNYDGGGKPVSREALSAFGNFAEFSALNLVGKARYFEIWNEWDNSREPRSVESYLAVVKSAVPRIRAANPQSVILIGSATTQGMRSGWVEALVRQGGLKYADGISVHPYVHCDRDARPEAWVEFIAEFSEKLRRANGGKTVPLFITEMGWPSHEGTCGVTPETAGRYAGRALLLARTIPSVRGFWWYDLKNDGTKRGEMEHNFGLLNFDYTKKPAYYALRDVAKVVRKGQRFQRLPAPTGVILISIDDSEGARSFALWTDNERSARLSVSIRRSKGGTMKIQTVGEQSGGDVPLHDAGFKTIEIDGNPRILSGGDSLVVESVNWNN